MHYETGEKTISVMISEALGMHIKGEEDNT